MRPTRYKREYAVAQTVADMKRRFVYPDEDTQPRNPVVGGGGGAMTVQVAASNASDMSTSKADFVATGVSDHETINAAFGVSGVARVVLSEGLFRIDTNQIRLPGDCHLTGMGWQTIIETGATSGTLIEMSGRDLVSDLRLQRSVSTSDTLVGIEMAAASTVRGVKGEVMATFIVVPGANQCLVTECFAHTCNTFVRATAVFERLLVTDNREIGAIDLGSGAFYPVITNNIFASISGFDMIAGTGATAGVIADNFFNSPTRAIDLSGVADLVIADNIVDLATDGFILAGDHMVIEGNVIGGEGFHGTDGIVVTGDHNVITANAIREPSQSGANTHDGIRVEGDENSVQGNKITPGATAPRSGINIAGGNDNAVYANYLGDASAYGTADFIDNGTGTMTAPGANGQFSF